MTIAITGASGFIGSYLRSVWPVDYRVVPRGVATLAMLGGSDAVVHLAGEPVAQRWTAAAKQRIHDSRVGGTRALVDAIAKCEVRPKVLVSAAAIGLYGDRGDEWLDEDAAPAKGFLADVSREWEAEASRAETFAETSPFPCDSAGRTASKRNGPPAGAALPVPARARGSASWSSRSWG